MSRSNAMHWRDKVQIRPELIFANQHLKSSELSQVLDTPYVSLVYKASPVGHYYQLTFQLCKIKQIFNIHLYNDTWKIQGSLNFIFFFI